MSEPPIPLLSFRPSDGPISPNMYTYYTTYTFHDGSESTGSTNSIITEAPGYIVVSIAKPGLRAASRIARVNVYRLDGNEFTEYNKPCSAYLIGTTTTYTFIDKTPHACKALTPSVVYFDSGKTYPIAQSLSIPLDVERGGRRATARSDWTTVATEINYNIMNNFGLLSFKTDIWYISSYTVGWNMFILPPATYSMIGRRIRFFNKSSGSAAVVVREWNIEQPPVSTITQIGMAQSSPAIVIFAADSSPTFVLVECNKTAPFAAKWMWF